MAQQIIDVGVNANSGDGDSLYEAGNKINNNFTEFFENRKVLSRHQQGHYRPVRKLHPTPF